jgi:hypothetical protein
MEEGIMTPMTMTMTAVPEQGRGRTREGRAP